MGWLADNITATTAATPKTAALVLASMTRRLCRS
jgi:hypothetical protein